MLLPLLALLTLLLSAADHWTTYLCLRRSDAVWEVTEANPLAAWLFERIGLVEGLALDSAVTVLGVAFLLATPWVPRPLKIGFLAAVVSATGVAVSNNLGVLVLLERPLIGL